MSQLKIKYSVDRRHKDSGILESSQWFDTIEEAEARLKEIRRDYMLGHQYWLAPFVWEIGWART